MNKSLIIIVGSLFIGESQALDTCPTGDQLTCQSVFGRQYCGLDTSDAFWPANRQYSWLGNVTQMTFNKLAVNRSHLDRRFYVDGCIYEVEYSDDGKVKKSIIQLDIPPILDLICTTYSQKENSMSCVPRGKEEESKGIYFP